jgi:hypothetical protein
MAADFDKIQKLTEDDIDALKKAETSYGDSWRRRGGVGAFMMLARKWDRIENQTNKQGYDMFAAIFADTSNAGILDDIRDLRRYLLLVESFTGQVLESANKNKIIMLEVIGIVMSICVLILIIAGVSLYVRFRRFF